MTFCTCVADFLSIVVCRTNERREYPVDNSRIGFNNVEDYLLVSSRFFVQVLMSQMQKLVLTIINNLKRHVTRFQVQRDYQMLVNTMRYHNPTWKRTTPPKGLQVPQR
jgi:hypothetical protein